MWENNRPEGWENPYEGNVYARIPQDDITNCKDGTARIKAVREEGAYELGADAILEALKKEGISMENFNPTNRTVMETASFLNKCENGWLVFIPD